MQDTQIKPLSLEALRRFCGGESSRKWMREPWQESGMACATNGAIIVSTPLAKEHGNLPGADGPRWERVTEGRFPPDAVHSAFPACPRPATCPVCNGAGIDDDGDCYRCLGRGLLAASIFIGGRWWDGIYLSLIGCLPQPKYRIQGDAMEFVFDGGRGLLMARRCE